MVFSAVRSGRRGGVGFVRDARRLNVAVASAGQREAPGRFLMSRPEQARNRERSAQDSRAPLPTPRESQSVPEAT